MFREYVSFRECHPGTVDGRSPANQLSASLSHYFF